MSYVDVAKFAANNKYWYTEYGVVKTILQIRWETLVKKVQATIRNLTPSEISQHVMATYTSVKAISFKDSMCCKHYSAYEFYKWNDIG